MARGRIGPPRRQRPYRGGQTYEMEARSIAVLRLRREDGDEGDVSDR